MRKIFLFSLAFFAITLQAKTLVHEFNLGPDETKFSPYDPNGGTYNATTKTWETKDNDAGQIWLGNFDAAKYYQLVLDLGSPITGKLKITVVYAGEGAGSQEYEIPEGKSQGVVDLDKHSIQKIELRNSSGNNVTYVFKQLRLVGQSGKKYAEVLDDTEHNVGAWTGFNVDANKFTHAYAGTQLVFNYTTNDYTPTEGGKYFQLQTKSGDAFLEGNDYALDDKSILNVNESSTQHIITLTENDVTNLQANGLAVNGHELTINNITLNYWDEKIEVLWTGEVVIEDWENDVTIESSAFAEAKQGDRIVCFISASEGAQAQIKYTTGENWGWVDLNECQDISGTTYKQILTQEMITSIVAGHQVHIQGKNYTITAVELLPSEVWSGEKAFDGGWGTNLELSKDIFAGIEAGYHVQLSVTSMTEDGCAMVQSDWLDLTHDTKHVFTAAEVEEGNIVIDIELQPSDVETILAHGLIVKGVNYTLTKVEVIHNLPSSNIMKHDLEITDAGMATIILPYSVPTLPEGIKAYTLEVQEDYIAATEVTTIAADQPVLIVAAKGDYVFESEEGATDAISGKAATYPNGDLVGTYQKGNVPNSSDLTYNYVLQNGAEGVGFYQVQSDDIAINPYRAYLSCDYNNQAMPHAPLRIIFHESGTTAIKNIATDNRPNKVVRNGRLYIQHDNQLYTIHGQKIQ